MEWLLLYAPAVACAAMMLVVCLPMMRRMSRGGCENEGPTNEEVTALREEVARLRAERTPDARSDEVTHV